MAAKYIEGLAAHAGCPNGIAPDGVRDARLRGDASALIDAAVEDCRGKVVEARYGGIREDRGAAGERLADERGRCLDLRPVKKLIRPGLEADRSDRSRPDNRLGVAVG